MSDHEEAGAFESTSFEDEFENIRERLGKLKSKDRRRTMEQLSVIFPEEHAAKPDVRDRNVPPPILGQQHAAVVTGQREGRITFETSNRRIKNFSAQSKPANGEVDFKHWHRAALRTQEDPDLPESQKKRIILQSLVGDAEDAIDPLRNLSVDELLIALEKMYGSMTDGNDLLANFYQEFQGKEQTAGEYLSQLFIALSEVVSSNGIAMSAMNKTILRQFLRGVHDEDLLNKLRLEDRVATPPSFPDLIALVRREESKRTERRLRHRKLVKSQATIVDNDILTVSVPQESKKSIPNAKDNEVIQLQQRISQLEDKMTQAKTGGKRKVFCYRCGMDGHVATDCNNVANKDLVKEKIENRKSAYGKANSGN